MKIARPVFHYFNDPQSLHEALAIRVADDLDEAIDLKGFATLMLSGGNTPKPFLAKLACEPIQWGKVRIGLVDERWVDPASAKSNEQLIRSTLLQGAAAKAAFYGMYTPDLTPEAAASSLQEQIRSEFIPFDVVVLGMGSDGHTASLFPSRPELAELLRPDSEVLCGVAEAPTEPATRLTLSLSAIASAAHCYLHIEGSEKLNVYQNALSGDDFTAMPIRALIAACNGRFETFYA